jgi:multidrug resistance efflux pump
MSLAELRSCAYCAKDTLNMRTDHIQRVIRSRTARLALAFGLIALSAWAFLPYVGYRISSSAFVNSELVRVTAPIAGRLTRDLPPKGDFIDQPQSVTLIEALSRDHRHLLQITSQYTVAKERADLARKQLAEIAATDDELSKRTKIYRAGMIARLGHERDESKAEKAGCLMEVEQRREVGARMEQLVKAGTASQIRTNELVSAQDGVFLRDGANDAPYSQQQRDRLLLRRQELETKVLEEGLQTSQLATEMQEERERLDRLSHFDLRLPGDHVVWSVAASPGSAVTEGQTLLDLADCQHRFVDVELPGREFEQIRPGAPAFVRLIGSDDWKQGQVRQVRGSAARADDRLLAAQVPKPDPNSITVEVGLPQEDATMDRKNFCNIGRLAEVRFERSGFAVLDGLNQKLQQLVGYFKRDTAIDHASK